MRKLPANSHSSGPTATAPVVNSTPQALLVAVDDPTPALAALSKRSLSVTVTVGCKTLFLEQLAHQFHGRSLVAPSLHQEIENLAFIVDRAPEPEPPARNRHGHLVEMPPRRWPWASVANFAGEQRPEFQDPSPHRFLGRSLPHLLSVVNGLKERGIAFRSLTEQMDTTTPQGEFLFHVFGALAQFERSLTQERVKAGLAAARRRGRRGGRPVAIDAEKLAAVIAALNAGASKAVVCRTFGVKRSTLINSLARIGWIAGLASQGDARDATTGIDRSATRRPVRSGDRTA